MVSIAATTARPSNNMWIRRRAGASAGACLSSCAQGGEWPWWIFTAATEWPAGEIYRLSESSSRVRFLPADPQICANPIKWRIAADGDDRSETEENTVLRRKFDRLGATMLREEVSGTESFRIIRPSFLPTTSASRSIRKVEFIDVQRASTNSLARRTAIAPPRRLPNRR